MKKKNRFYLKILNLFLCSNMLLNWSSQFDLYAINTPAQLSIPSGLGTVSAQWNSKNESESFVVHIKDVHCNYHAQKNIADIISILVKKFKIPLVSVEGATSKLDTSVFQVFPDKEVRRKVCLDFLKSGTLSGAEYLSITEGETNPFIISGIENGTLYLQNIKVFRNVIVNAKKVFPILEKIESETARQKNRLYSEPLSVFDKHSLDYLTAVTTLDVWANYLFKQVHEHNLSLDNYTNFSLLISLITSQEDNGALSHEIDKIMSQLKTDISQEKFAVLKKSYALYNIGNLSNKIFLTELEPYLASFPDSYPIIKSILNKIHAKDEIVFSKLMKELDDIENLIRLHLIRQQSDDSIDTENRCLTLSKITKTLFMFKKMSTLTLNHQEYLDYKDEENFSVSEIVKYIHDLHNQSKTEPEFISSFEQTFLIKSFRQAKSFYDIADERSNVMVANLFSLMEKHNTPQAIIVSGGFHSDIIEKKLSDNDISYLTITPNQTKINPELYLSLMLRTGTKLDIPFSPTPESVAFPIMCDLSLAQSPFFNQLRSELAQNLLMHKGLPLKNYIKQLKNDSQRNLFARLVQLAGFESIEEEMTIETLLSTLSVENLRKYILEQTDGNIEEYVSSLGFASSPETTIPETGLIADYLLDILDLTIEISDASPDVNKIIQLYVIYKNSNTDSMSILHTRVRKKLLKRLDSTILNFLILKELVESSYDVSKINVMTRAKKINIWTNIVKQIDVNDPEFRELVETSLKNLQTTLQAEYKFETLINESSPSVPMEPKNPFLGRENVTFETVNEWLLKESDTIKDKLSRTEIDFNDPDVISQIKLDAKKYYERLRRTLYTLTKRYELNLVTPISEISTLIWLFEEFDTYADLTPKQLSGILQAIDYRFLKEKGYLPYLKQGLELKINPAIFIDRNLQSINIEVLKTIINEVTNVPTDILSLFPDFGNIFSLLGDRYSLGAANEYMLNINPTFYDDIYSKTIFIHEFIGHNLIFRLIKNAFYKNDIDAFDSILSPEDILSIYKSSIAKHYDLKDIRLISRHFRRSVTATLNADESVAINETADTIYTVFKEYNTQCPAKHKIKWNDKMMMNIPFDFLEWAGIHHKKLFWLLVFSDLHFDITYSPITHKSLICHRIYDSLFEPMTESNYTSFSELIAYALADDERPNRRTSRLFVKYDSETVLKIRHIMGKNILGGWLWSKQKGWCYNNTPEQIISEITKYKGSPTEIKHKLKNNSFFRHLYPKYFENLSDLLVPAITVNDIKKVRDIMEINYFEGWQRYKGNIWYNVVSDDTPSATEPETIDRSQQTDHEAVEQKINDFLAAIGIAEDEYLREQIIKRYYSNTTKPISLSLLTGSPMSQAMLKNLLRSQFSSLFPKLVNLAQDLNIKEPHLIGFIYDLQNLINEYIDLKSPDTTPQIETPSALIDQSL